MTKNASEFVSECKKLGIDPKIGNEEFMSVYVGAWASWTSHGREAQGFLVHLASLMTKADGRNPTVKGLKKQFDTIRDLFLADGAKAEDYYDFEIVLHLSCPQWLIQNGNEVKRKTLHNGL